MNYKKIGMIVIILTFFQLTNFMPTSRAEETGPNITMVYMTSDGLPNTHISFLEATFSAFANNIVLVEANAIDEASVTDSQVIVFIGDKPGVVPDSLLDVIRSFTGEIVAFGHNVEQLHPYKQWEFEGIEHIRKLAGESLSTIVPIVHVSPPNEAEIILMGETILEPIPFIVKKGRLSYIATTSFGTTEKYLISQSVFKLLNQHKPINHQAYLRLEDISPISSPKHIKEVGDYLADRAIPFYMSIVPVHINTTTGEQIQLSENKELVEVLQHLQKRGGMVLAHSYAHLYRYSEEGEELGFVGDQLNLKLENAQLEQLPPSVKRSTAFPSEEAYNQYKYSINSEEEKVIGEKHTKSIEQLTNLELYPIAFEASHDIMSTNGYQVTSKYFSSVFGQASLFEANWGTMDSPLFITRPASFGGMTLYPETIGALDFSLANPFEKMEIAVEQLKMVPGSAIGGVYHPYLGVEYLPRMIQLMESVPNVEWLDLRQTDQVVQTDRITIVQEVGQSLEVTSTIRHRDILFQQLESRPFEVALWILAFIVTVFLVIFSTYVIGLRARLRKRLFEER